MKYEEREFYRLLNRAYIRDGNATHEGESLILACLLHSKGKTRVHGNSKDDDMADVQRIMRDHNRKK